MNPIQAFFLQRNQASLSQEKRAFQRVGSGLRGLDKSLAQSQNEVQALAGTGVALHRERADTDKGSKTVNRSAVTLAKDPVPSAEFTESIPQTLLQGRLWLQPGELLQARGLLCPSQLHSSLCTGCWGVQGSEKRRLDHGGALGQMMVHSGVQVPQVLQCYSSVESLLFTFSPALGVVLAPSLP